MKENREFNMLENADDKTVELLSEFPVLTKEEKERMLAMSKNKLDKKNRERNINISSDEYQVSGVERYKRSKWQAFASMAACLLLVGGIGGTVFALNRKNHNIVNDNNLASVTTTIEPSSSSADGVYREAADKLLAEYRAIEALSYGLTDGIVLDENDTKHVENYDGSDVTYYRVKEKWNSVDEVKSYLAETMTGNLLRDYEALLTCYLGEAERFKEIDGNLYFKKGGGSISGITEYDLEICDEKSFNMIIEDEKSNPKSKEVFHAVLENGVWKLDSYRIDVESQDQDVIQAPTEFDETSALALLSELELVERMLAGGIDSQIDKEDSIEFPSPDGSYVIKYNRIVTGGMLDLNNIKEMVRSTVTEPVLSETYCYIYEDKENDLPVFKEIDGKLYMRDYARGARFDFTGTPELIRKSDTSYDIITENNDPGGAPKRRITAVFENGSWKVSSFGYTDDEQPASASNDIDYSDSALMEIAKEAPKMLNDVLKVQNGTVETDPSDHLDNDTIYKYCGATNPANISYSRVTDPRFSSIDDIKDFISARTVGAFREGLMNGAVSNYNSGGFSIYIVTEDGKLYSCISRFGGLDFADEVEITNATETKMTVRVKVGAPIDDYMSIFLELEDGQWKISTYRYQ